MKGQEIYERREENEDVDKIDEIEEIWLNVKENQISL